MKTLVKKMLYEWKVLVYFGRMSVEEYDARREAINELYRRMGKRAPRPPGWQKLRKRMQEKYPDMIVPATVRDRCYWAQPKPKDSVQDDTGEG